MQKAEIYLDIHATTPIDPRVLEAMLPFLRTKFGNAASRNHSYGWDAEEAVERARGQIAKLIGASSPEEIVFTSGATESDNLAIKGISKAYRHKGNQLITVATEHSAVLETCRALEHDGLTQVKYLPVDGQGLLDLDGLSAAIMPNTVLVSVMAANNEIGVLQDLGRIGKICRERGVFFHTDAAQAAGKIPLDVEAMNIDLMSISGHKMYAPKGIGVLYVRKKHPTLKRTRLAPILDGGGHERGWRSGTLNVPAIVAMGEACAIAQREMREEANRVAALRDRLWTRLQEQLDRVHLNGDQDRRLPGNLHVSVEYVEAESLIMNVAEIAISSGAACTTAKIEPSHVLKALGVPEDLLYNSIRIGIGRFNTADEVDLAADHIVRAVRRLRELSPTYARARQTEM